MGPCVHACCQNRGLCCAGEADAVLDWLDGLARDAALVDDGAYPSKRRLSILIIPTPLSLITEAHHRLASLLLHRIRLLRPAPCQERIWCACREASERTRATSSWKGVIRRPHADLFVLRARVVRGRATTRGDAGLRHHITLPNELLWQVLNYWHATQ